MENVWDYLRGNILSHKVWDTYNAIVQACAKAWRFLIADPERIRSIAHRNWASVIGYAGWYYPPRRWYSVLLRSTGRWQREPKAHTILNNQAASSGYPVTPEYRSSAYGHALLA